MLALAAPVSSTGALCFSAMDADILNCVICHKVCYILSR
jgi:hypothetical protein